MAVLGTDEIIIERSGTIYKAPVSEALAGTQRTIAVGTTAPVSPATNDLWVDTN